MKKVAYIVVLAFIAITANAQGFTGQYQIKLTSEGMDPSALNILLGSDFSDAFDQSFDATAMNKGIYAYKDGNRYEIWASDKMKNLRVGFDTGEKTAYTLTFRNILGEAYELYDIVEDSTIVVNAPTGTYQFNISADQTKSVINDRFLINYEFTPDEGELNICFNEKGTNILEIKNNPYTGKIAIKNAAGEDVLRSPYQPLKTPQEIDLSSLPAGRYTVILTKDDEEKKLIIVK